MLLRVTFGLVSASRFNLGGTAGGEPFEYDYSTVFLAEQNAARIPRVIMQISSRYNSFLGSAKKPVFLNDIIMYSYSLSYI